MRLATGLFVLAIAFSLAAEALTLPPDSVGILVGQKFSKSDFSVPVGGLTVPEAAKRTGLGSLALSDASRGQGDGTRFSPSASMPIPKGGFVAFALAQARMANSLNPAYCVPESVTVAQAVLESASGTSRVARENNNLFGIKKYSGSARCKSGASAYCFYNSVADSFADHNYFFYRNSRYRSAVSCRQDFECFATKIRQAGYAEDPNYVSKLLGIIRGNGLAKYNSCA